MSVQLKTNLRKAFSIFLAVMLTMTICPAYSVAFAADNSQLQAGTIEGSANQIGSSEDESEYALLYTLDDGGATIEGYVNVQANSNTKPAGKQMRALTISAQSDEGEHVFEGPTTYDANLVIPSEIDGRPVTAIGDSAFEDATWLESVSVPPASRR